MGYTNVVATYTEHQLFKNGKFFYKHEHILEGCTDHIGHITFPDQPSSVFDYIFFNAKKLDIKATKSLLHGSASHPYHRHKRDIPFYVPLSGVVVRVVDCDNGEPVPNAAVEWQIDRVGSGLTNSDGLVCVGDSTCSYMIDYVKIHADGYVDTTYRNVDIHEGIEGDSVIELCIHLLRKPKVFLIELCREGHYNSLSSTLLKEGYEVVLYSTARANNIERFRSDLDSGNCQIWIIADWENHLSAECCNLICEYYNKGVGLYILADNHPYYADANVILRKLFGFQMEGDCGGCATLSRKEGKGTSGIVAGHPLTNGVNSLFEGVSVSYFSPINGFTPIAYNSCGKVFIACKENDGKRVIVDGGFTRLFDKYWANDLNVFVVNCAKWLAGKK